MPRRARVIVTTYERLPWLRLALRAWCRQTFQDFALTVADDGSGPETTSFVKEFAATAPFPVDHVWWENKGFRRAAILNEAVRRSSDEALLLFTDGDCIPPADFLEGHLRVHGPRSFAVGGAIKLTLAASDALTGADIDTGRHERLGSFFDRFELRRKRWKSIWGVALRRPRRPKVVGLNVGMDRALFEEINGYDESFVGWGLEDSDVRDRVMASRPRPVVRVLYGTNDTIHLWHPAATTMRQHVNRPYYEAEGRPVRCVNGLRDERLTASTTPVVAT